MILAITYLFHDYEAKIKYVDTTNMSRDDYIDGRVLAAIDEDKNYVFIDACNWEEEPEKFPRGDAMGLSVPWLEERPEHLDRALILHLSFE